MFGGSGLTNFRPSRRIKRDRNPLASGARTRPVRLARAWFTTDLFADRGTRVPSCDRADSGLGCCICETTFGRVHRVGSPCTRRLHPSHSGSANRPSQRPTRASVSDRSGSGRRGDSGAGATETVIYEQPALTQFPARAPLAALFGATRVHSGRNTPAGPPPLRPHRVQRALGGRSSSTASAAR